MHLKNSKIIVIKIGSSLIVDNKKKIRKKWLSSFAKDIQKLKSKNKKIIIVSSGAIALGCKKMNYNKSNLKLDKSQAIASVGQIELMNLFSQTFSKLKINISQILLTLDDTEERRRSINAKRTFENLFKLDYIPIVNENDTIATSEIKYGDNDRLASRVAQITNADTLILLSDVDGLFTKNPKLFKDAKLIKKVNNLDKDMKKIYIKGVTEFGKGYNFGTGGSAVAENSTGMVNPRPMMPAEEPSFQADRSTRAFNPAQAATILAQYGSMKERNEAAGLSLIHISEPTRLAGI